MEVRKTNFVIVVEKKRRNDEPVSKKNLDFDWLQLASMFYCSKQKLQEHSLRGPQTRKQNFAAKQFQGINWPGESD